MNTRLPAPPTDDEVDAAPAPNGSKPKSPAQSPHAPPDDLSGDAPDGAPAPAKGTPAGRSLPPVGDIQLSKVKGTYNTYKMEISYGQLEAVRAALEKDHAEPVSDELLQIMSYYMDKLPGPGEEEEDIKARDEAAKNGTPGLEDDDEAPLPAPPGMEDEGDVTPGEPGAGDEEDTMPPPRGGGGSSGHSSPRGHGGALPEAPAPTEADERLEAPPAE